LFPLPDFVILHTLSFNPTEGGFDMPVDDIVLEAEEQMEKAVNYIRAEMRTIRTGRASSALVEHLKVSAYETEMSLRELANITTPEANMLAIKPFDPGTMKAIEKALLTSDLGLTPASDGKIMRLTFPPLSGERRKQLTTQVKQLGEQAKVGIRSARRDANKKIDQEKKDSSISEDEAESAKDEIQELTKKYEGLVDQAIEAKNKEIMTL
jgi:ribosome recycling factor